MYQLERQLLSPTICILDQLVDWQPPPIANLLSEGLCPRCLLAAAMEDATDGEFADTIDSGSSKRSRAGELHQRLASLNKQGDTPALVGEYMLVEEIARRRWFAGEENAGTT